MAKKDKEPSKKLTIQDTIGGLLPKGFSLVPTSQQKRVENQRLWQDRQQTFSQVHARTSQIRHRQADHWEKREREHKLINQAPSAALVLPNLDPFEEYRQSQDLHIRRDELTGQLLKELTIENGLLALNNTLRKLHQPTVSTIEEVFKAFPNMTKTEILLFGLCTQVPEMFVTGKIKKIDSAVEAGEEQLFHKTIPVVPSIFAANTQGLLCMPDTLNPNEIQKEDIFSNLGITGADESIVTAPFRPEVKAAITELIPLLISNFRLHDLLWTSEKTDSALQDGFGKLDRYALEKTTGEASPTQSIASIISRLEAPLQIQFSQTRQEAEDTIAANSIIDLHNNVALPLIDVVRIIGLLDRIPSILLQKEEPFQGYFVPYGPGLLFLGTAGEVKEYVPYNPYYLREVFQGFYTETVDTGKTNKTLAQIFNMLAQQATGIVMEKDQSASKLSAIETLALDIKLQWNITTPFTPHMKTTKPKNWAEAADFQSAKQIIDPLYKMGTEELQQITSLLKLVPKPMLEGIRELRKQTHVEFPMEAFLTGVHVMGEFNRQTGTIFLYQTGDLPFINFSPQLKEQRAFTFMHEVAHNVWYKLTREQKSAWKKISWDQKGKVHSENLEADFLTQYSHSSNEKEDFCEHFASYMLHGPEFRQKATPRSELEKKYIFLQHVFAQFTGQDTQYGTLSQFTIEQIQGYVDAEINRLTEEEAHFLSEQTSERKRRIAHAAMGDSVVWIDHTPKEIDPILGKELDKRLIDRVEREIASEAISDLRDIFDSSRSISATEAVKRARNIYKAFLDEKDTNHLLNHIGFLDEMDEHDAAEILANAKKD